MEKLKKIWLVVDTHEIIEPCLYCGLDKHNNIHFFKILQTLLYAKGGATVDTHYFVLKLTSEPIDYIQILYRRHTFRQNTLI